MNNILIIGCGDIGLRVATILQQNDTQITGLCRHPHSAAKLAEHSIRPLTWDLDDGRNLPLLRSHYDVIYYFAPPPLSGDTDPRIQRFLALLTLQKITSTRLILISTSGVYGDHQGASVDETTPPNPQASRSKRRYDAETQLTIWAKQSNIPYNILRVGGIYGPGRLPEKRIRDQVPVLQEYLAPCTNRIHADDLAAICIKVASHGKPNRLYNVCDGQHGNMTEYFFTIADAMGLPRPPEINWQQAEKSISPGMMSYLKESRSLDISRLQKDLDIQFQYPDLVSGLKAILNN